MSKSIFTAVSSALPKLKKLQRPPLQPLASPSQSIISVNTHEIHASENLSVYLKEYLNKRYIILCIGTDLCIADCLGPLIGSKLLEYNLPLPIIGTLKNPVHAVNYSQKLSQIRLSYPDYKILAVDAALSGNIKRIGMITLECGNLVPGIGAGNHLAPVGDINITGIVNTKYVSPLSDIRLSLIVDMADVIVSAIVKSIQSG
jgi:putative sporulation protein YyaC